MENIERKNPWKKSFLLTSFKDQISKLTNCSLRRIGSLDFHFNGGGCANFGNEKIVLCFDYYERKQCWTAETALGLFKRTTEAHFDHKLIRIAASEGLSNLVLS